MFFNKSKEGVLSDDSLSADSLSDEPMDVDEIYLSSDENFLTDDEEVTARIFGISTSTKRASPSDSFDSFLITTALGKLGMQEISELEAVNFNVRDFPEDYRFLLDLPAINETALRQYPKLFNLLCTEPQTISQMIDKQVAVICLYWAQGILDCSRSLLANVQVKLQDATMVRSKFNSKKYLFQVRFYIEYGANNYKGREPKRGMIVFFRTKDGRKVSTRISKIEAGKCYFVIRIDPEKEEKEKYLKLKDETVDVFQTPDEFIPVSMIRSIKELRTGFLNHILSPQPTFSEERYQYIERKAQQMGEFMQKYRVSDRLTSAQQDAIFAICNKEHMDSPFVLFGPPGTGKTFVISETIQTFLKMSDSNRLLVCTPSNMAADHVAEQLMKDFGGVLNVKTVLRLRSTGNNYYLRDPKFDDIISCDEENDVYTIPKSFKQWRVIVCTLGASTHLVNAGCLAGFFNAIIIDEAGQCSEPELWIPLGGLATPETSVILCGDPKQLGPVITLDLSNQLKKKFTAPLIRYMEDEQYKADKRLCCQLVDCFRCHRSLVDIVSALFYDRKLLPMGPRIVNFDFAGLEMKADFPILFVAANGEEIQPPRQFSFCNPVEADICLKYANFFITQRGVEPEQIGIISPYTYQSKTITDKMRAMPNARQLQKITVSSVEKFQGSEREIIIISGTRTRSLGFMADELRVNTSLTRAKKLLIVVGNEELLRRHEAWNGFIDYCGRNNSIKRWDPKVDPKFEIEAPFWSDFENLKI